ncbi:MAG: hypothetical protein JWN86_3886 [Planctomycetota bacterium]|nr:hypothetical protein [Planctomycetota bacterium]
MFGIYDDHGIRFEYPPEWVLDVADEGTRTTISVQSPSGLAFAMVSVDADRPPPATMVDEALGAMKEEYPELELMPAIEEIDGHKAVGHDLEFISLDVLNGCAIRSFRTKRRTILVFGQWSEVDDEVEPTDSEALIQAMRRTLEETDA